MAKQQPGNIKLMHTSFRLLLLFALVIVVFTLIYVMDERPFYSADQLVQYCYAITWPVVITPVVKGSAKGGKAADDEDARGIAILPMPRKSAVNASIDLLHATKKPEPVTGRHFRKVQSDQKMSKSSEILKERQKDQRVVKKPDVSKEASKKSEGLLDKIRPPTPRPKPKPMPGKKYLIYLCDSKVYCFGLGDRQRAIGGLYILATLTNRKFGVIMTDPSPFTDLYEPNEIQWIIPKSELANKTTKELIFFPMDFMPVSKIDFNKIYPQDVIYFRTNNNYLPEFGKNPLYKDRLPKVPTWQLYPLAWTKLMRPTEYLRRALNEQLKIISLAMSAEFEAYETFDFSGCKTLCNNITKVEDCIQPNVTGKALLMKDSTPNYCVVSEPQFLPEYSPDEIMTLRGHDTVDLNLVCVHLRLGKTSTFHWEKKARNNITDLPVVWKFLRPYVDKGHHVYIATDSIEGREAAKAEFGYRVHTSPEPIVHIGHVLEGQDKKEGFRLVAMEQLLLSTSCQVLVISYSNLSLKAAMVRGHIHKGDNLFLFKKGRVFPFSNRRLF